MKKLYFIRSFILLGYLFAYKVSYAGLITHQDYNPGDVITAAKQNTNENAVFNEFNGNIDNTNVKSGGLAFSNFNTVVISSVTSLQNLFAYRKPKLQWLSASTVSIETGTISGTTGASIIFPDGTLVTDSTSGHIVFNITQDYSQTQSGLFSGTVSTNTWWAIYAVRVAGGGFVAVGTTTACTPPNYALLNTNFGQNSWEYLGIIRYGNNDDTTNAILFFVQVGPVTLFQQQATTPNMLGIARLGSGGATSLTAAYAVGFINTSIPDSITMLQWGAFFGSATGGYTTQESAGSIKFAVVGANGASTRIVTGWVPAVLGLQINQGGSASLYGNILGFVDSALAGGQPLF